MAEWPTFGNVIDNVISDWGTPLDGQRSLKMFGQFNSEENYSGAFQNLAISGGERFTAGAHTLTRSEDSIAGTGNTAIMKVEFYSQAGAAYGSSFFAGEIEMVVADGSLPEDAWLYSELTGIAPGNAVEARVTLLFQQPASNPGGAVFIDSVTFEIASCPADITGEGVLNFFDVATFVGLYTEQDAIADWNLDGLINFFDVADYISLFNLGCP